MNRNLNPDEFEGAWPEKLPEVGEESFPHRNRGNQLSLKMEKERRDKKQWGSYVEKMNARVGEEVEVLDLDTDRGERVPAGHGKFAGLRQGTAQIEFPDGHTEPRPHGGYRFLKD